MKTVIPGDQLTLKRLEEAFVLPLFEAAAESCGGEFSRWMPWCHANYALADSQSFVAQSQADWEKGAQYNFAIFDNADAGFSGIVSLSKFNAEHHFVNLGYWVRTSKQNRGIAAAAARMLAAAAFEQLPINRLEILAAVENIPSRKAAEKSGAAREGILRARLLIGTRKHDAVMFSFIREDFESAKTENL